MTKPITHWQVGSVDSVEFLYLYSRCNHVHVDQSRKVINMKPCTVPKSNRLWAEKQSGKIEEKNKSQLANRKTLN